MTTERSITLFSPAKVNLLLAITGVREDGYHNLVSLVCPIDFGDTVSVALTWAAEADTLRCDDPTVPTGEDNLIMKAIEAFRQQHLFEEGVLVDLTKRIPMGAGLGGGSSNAATTLKALNELCGGPLSDRQLQQMAASLGADCSLFLESDPVVMRGYGEQVSEVPAAIRSQVAGKRLLLFKPDFPVDTAWAYAQMKERGTDYLPETQAEALLAAWGQAPKLYNNMELAVLAKHTQLKTLLDTLRNAGCSCLMSGSGSSCFVLLDDAALVEEDLQQMIREALGEGIFMTEAKIIA